MEKQKKPEDKSFQFVVGKRHGGRGRKGRKEEGRGRVILVLQGSARAALAMFSFGFFLRHGSSS